MISTTCDVGEVVATQDADCGGIIYGAVVSQLTVIVTTPALEAAVTETRAVVIITGSDLNR